MTSKLASGGVNKMAIADAVTGVITVSVLGITAALTPKDAGDWAKVLTEYAPLLLIAFLIWRLRLLDKQLTQCEVKHSDMNQRLSDLNEKLLLAYSAIRSPGNQRLPDMQRFNSKDFDLKECIDDSCEVPNANRSDR